MSGLICPKCGAAMRAYERRGITIEQCVECRGIYLDRGELERLTDAEAAYDGDQRHHRQDDDDEPRHGERPRKRRGFLDDIFDFG